MKYDDHFDLACKKRNELWKSVGDLDDYVIAGAINPAFFGGPRWPSLRQAFLCIETPDLTIMATDGLSDPYDDFDTNPSNQVYNGLGLELYMAAPRKQGGLTELMKSWELRIFQNLAQQVASNPNIVSMLDEYTFLSISLFLDGLPESLVNDKGETGVLLGLKSKLVPDTLELSLETIRLVNVTVLTPAELAYIIADGGQGRIELAEKLMKVEHSEVVSMDRPSVV
ncbi:MAG: suppressor of fused domain protein [Chitinophagaceae bacterium]|nr:suppressor of fused domain protein [Chitinophagaceae bacterium]